MKINLNTGMLEISESVKFYPGMTRENLLNQKEKWEDWIVTDNQKIAYRLIVNLTSIDENMNLVTIVFFRQNNGTISQLNFSPSDKFDGHQKKPEGKYTKLARIWFEKHFNSFLPINNSWGNIDASYDPHNLYAEIVCIYK